MTIAQDLVTVPCTRCGAKVGELCLRLTPGRFKYVDYFHAARWQAFRDDGEDSGA